jgi:ankyrin repeat protein
VYGWTPLMRAVDNGYRDAVRALLRHGGSDLAAADEAGMTALHHAARRGWTAIARLLIEAGAPVSARDRAGRTPADIAAAGGRENLLAILTRHHQRESPRGE